MFVFVCAGCGATLTAPLSRVTLPVEARQTYGNGVQMPVLMESGTFAVDPEPGGPPWRMWDEIGPDEAAARGVYAPVCSLSDGPRGAVVIAPGDTRGTRLIPEKLGGACCGLDGADGPNMACEACGLPVATRIDDCSLWQAVWLTPDAVRRHRVGADSAPLTWAQLAAVGQTTPPYEPIQAWGRRLRSDRRWSWSPRWEAAAGRALAHLLVASEGHPVTVPEGLTLTLFGRALDTLLPARTPRRRAVLAGPGLPDGDADMLLAPVHPQTEEVWTPAGDAAPATSVAFPYLVPLPYGIWRALAFPEPHLPVPASGGMPTGVFRDDDPRPPLPQFSFRVDGRVFLDTLARLPAVREPWLHEIFGSLTPAMRGGVF